MIAIKDFVGMPSCCMNCILLGKEEMYCSIHPRKDLDIITVATNRPNWCPLVEIEERKVGKWIKQYTAFVNDDNQIVAECHCSNCYGIAYFRSLGNKLVGANYCPVCGSFMESKE